MIKVFLHKSILKSKFQTFLRSYSAPPPSTDIKVGVPSDFVLQVNSGPQLSKSLDTNTTT